MNVVYIVTTTSYCGQGESIVSIFRSEHEAHLEREKIEIQAQKEDEAYGCDYVFTVQEHEVI